MINHFRSLSPFNFFLLAVFLCLFRFNSFISPDILNNQSDLLYLSEKAPFLGNFLLSIPAEGLQVLCCVAIYLQALWINSIIHNYNLLGKPNHMPAMMYLICMNIITPFYGFRLELLLNFLVILLIQKSVELYKQTSSQMTMFDAGMFISIGIYIYPSFIVTLLITLITLSIFHPFNWREWIALPLGTLATGIIAYSIYLFNHPIQQIPTLQWKIQPSLMAFQHIDPEESIKIGVLLVSSFFALFKIREKFWSSYILIRRFFQVMFIFIILLTLSYVLSPYQKLSHFMLCAPPISILLAYYFLNSNVRWMYNTLYLLLTGGIIFYNVYILL